MLSCLEFLDTLNIYSSNLITIYENQVDFNVCWFSVLLSTDDCEDGCTVIVFVPL